MNIIDEPDDDDRLLADLDAISADMNVRLTEGARSERLPRLRLALLDGKEVSRPAIEPQRRHNMALNSTLGRAIAAVLRTKRIGSRTKIGPMGRNRRQKVAKGVVREVVAWFAMTSVSG